MNKIEHNRIDYNLHKLSKSDLVYSPLNQFKLWFNEVSNNVLEANAMVLSTSDNHGIVDSRVVLLKQIAKRGFVFYTNYNSLKAKHLEVNSNVSLCFFWPEFQRQVRIQGIATKISSKASENYFNSRPRKSQISAWVSQQSSPIINRLILEDRFINLDQEFKNIPIKKPDFWGGYNVCPKSVEFWQGRASRLHDRFLYTKKNGKWVIDRLSP